jgi:hypothetical protein
MSYKGLTLPFLYLIFAQNYFNMSKSNNTTESFNATITVTTKPSVMNEFGMPRWLTFNITDSNGTVLSCAYQFSHVLEQRLDADVKLSSDDMIITHNLVKSQTTDGNEK